MSIKCCKDCKERHPHCHATCLRYLEEKMEHERQRERANKIKKPNQICLDTRKIRRDDTGKEGMNNE